MANDASPVASTEEFRFRRDMHNAPTGKRILLINESGVMVQGAINNTNRNHFIEWQYLPKRALPKEISDE